MIKRLKKLKKIFKGKIKNIFHVINPFIIYILVMLFVQLIWSFALCFYYQNYSSVKEISIKALSMMQKQSIYITFVSSLVLIPIFLKMCKKEQNQNQIYNERYFKRINIKQLLTTLFLGVITAVTGNLIANCFAYYCDINQTSMYKSSNHIIMYLCIGIATPIVEELLFRCLLYFRLLEHKERSFSIICVSFLFALCHESIIAAIYAFILSIILLMIWELSENLVLCIIAHIIANVVTITVSVLNINIVINSNIIVGFIFVGLILSFISIFLFMLSNMRFIREKFKK